MSDLRFVDLFAGIGGFHQALGPAGLGMSCVFASEIDQDAAELWAEDLERAGQSVPDALRGRIAQYREDTAAG